MVMSRALSQEKGSFAKQQVSSGTDWWRFEEARPVSSVTLDPETFNATSQTVATSMV